MMTADMSAVDEINRRSAVTMVLRAVNVLSWRYHGYDATGVFHWSVGPSDSGVNSDPADPAMRGGGLRA